MLSYWQKVIKMRLELREELELGATWRRILNSRPACSFSIQPLCSKPSSSSHPLPLPSEVRHQVTLSWAKPISFTSSGISVLSQPDAYTHTHTRIRLSGYPGIYIYYTYPVKFNTCPHTHQSQSKKKMWIFFLLLFMLHIFSFRKFRHFNTFSENQGFQS